MIIRRYFILSLSALMLAGCAGDEEVNNSSSTDERLPLRLEATLSGNRHVTRAVGSEFETDDVLYSYVQHVYNKDGNYTQVPDIQASLVEFTNPTVDGNTYNLTPGTALYWDDFSKSSDDGANDLYTVGHGLRSYYGYCYNGTEITSGALTESTGVLTWSASTNQSADGIKTSDLLWSNTQAPVEYKHAVLERGKLTVPYTHAMSKFTVVVVAGDGFKADDLTGASVTLHDMNITGTFTAPTGKVTETSKDIVTMFGNEKDGNQRIFEAIVVPTTSLAENKHLATITMAGNTYKVNISAGMLTSWADGIENAASKSGVNYKLTVELKKQKVTVSATLANWNTVKATGEGEIQFDGNFADLGSNYEKVKAGDSFALWMAEAGVDFGSDASTLVTYDSDANRFTNNTAVYWPDGTTKFKFRALAEQTSAHTLQAVTTTSIVKDDNSKLPDLLWGTSGEDAIAPRTGDVPLTFKHALSNVIVTLETTTGDAAVTLAGASVTLANLNTEGTINIADAEITSKTPSDNAFTGVVDSEKYQVSTLMIPQEFSADARLIVTLADKTTYSLKLSSITAIPKWEGGNKYIYTIHLKKEEIKFSATIQPWVEKTGSGKADLDWD
ncbi:MULTISPECIES: fimbrillin family protein [Prevotellaceae]|uniref:fimbrillin family protein n=1 Tax=Prevotellaceae TaxID=171552 RepID=UPI0015A2D375|nr:MULTISPECIES: fimbrillin family protein [Prevotellaceae]QVJ80939.1 fimbrillin family protein [Xylanibacter ruminicola]